MLESERRFRLLVQGVTDHAIYMLSPEGRVANWNAGASRIKGYSASEIVGEHFSRFYTPEDIAAGLPSKALETARLVGRYEAEGWRRRKDGTRFWANVVIEAIYDDGNLVGFAKITRDLTERRNNQIELEESREQLFQAQKMEAVGQLTGGLAHDFNNLLTAISGSLELLQRRVAQGRVQEIDHYVATAQKAAARATGLTHRLLAFARRQTLEPKKINPNKLIAGMKEMVERTVGPEIELKVTPSGGIWPTSCDPNQLENAILNLCINARDAMPDGGQLTIKTLNTEFDEYRATAHDMTPGEYVEIRIIDTGTGMSPAVAARAFDPFYTTKPAGQGTGLGLSMVYGFAKQSGGQVRISSQIGSGTTVHIWLPRDFGEAEEELPQPILKTGSRARDGETVLIVDDEPTVRMLVSDVLDELGYAAIEAPDAAAALKVLQSNVRLDLLITDVGLPGGMNGRQMADAARLHRPSLPVLFITGYAERAAIRSGDLEPGMHVLIKPFAMEDLVSRIESIIER
jgi:PAS domain S-box-containing protein